MPFADRELAEYPRPQLRRDNWLCLDGTWQFAYDDEDRGLLQRWYTRQGDAPFEHAIQVPFPPESQDSGMGDAAVHPVVWYRREVTLTVGRHRHVVLHFGAVDHEADVWVDGEHVGSHRGGYTAFSFDITHALRPGATHTIVVRAHDDVEDVDLPRGKQDWQPQPHVIWYHRSTGIWRTVWLETVPEQHIVDLSWQIDLDNARLDFDLELAAPPTDDTVVEVVLSLADTEMGRATTPARARRLRVSVPVPALDNGQARDAYLWTPEHPVLFDVKATLGRGDEATDVVYSYLGVRTTSTESGRFLLNGRPYTVRAVLEQGYWPDSLYTPPSVDAMRHEVELIKELGFNTARIHQKIEDPRLLHWADRLGLLLWGELPSAYRYGTRMPTAILTEWLEAVHQQRNHPSVVTWVPLNESWGVQDIASRADQQAFARALADVTRAVDPSRPVISNDGWEHQNSDIIGIHDYDHDPDTFESRYANEAARSTLVRGFGPAGRRMFVGDAEYVSQPIMITEFGGVSFQPGERREDGWGYVEEHTAAEWMRRIDGLYRAIHRSDFVVGSCYTQLTDTLQETNGLCTADREPKAPIEMIRRAVLGSA